MATYRITAPDGGTYEVTAPDTASESDVLAYAQKNYQAKPAEVSAPTKPKTFMQSAGDFLAGGVRGAGSIGATILAPVDMAKDALDGKGLSLQSNRQRRADMDGALGQLGADTDSMAYGVGKLGGEIAGTAGIGGVLAKPLQALAASRYGAGIEPLLEGGARALQTGGFRVGPLAGTSAAIPARIIGGAATGGAAAGLVNPEDAPLGAVIGGTLPVAAQFAGKTGEKIGSALRSGPSATPEKLATARASMDAGYLLPPSQVNPSFRNRTLESMSGKFETAQLASTKNQEVTNSLVRKSLGLADDAPLTQESMQAVRKQAGQVYQQLKGTGTVAADQQYTNALDNIAKTVKSATASFPQLGKTNMHGQPIDEIGGLVASLKQPQFDAGGAVDAISVLRDNADQAYRAGNNALGKANKSSAKALEDMLDRHLQQIGATDLLPAYRDARQLIAKTYTVEKGLREGAGTVDARALGRELQKKKPLSGDLLTVARFGNTFDKAAQPPHLIGSPAVNALKPMMSLMTSGIGGATMGPGGLALGAVNYALPPAARSVMFSKQFQQSLLGPSAPMLGEAPMGLLTQGAYRAAPLLSGQ
jgi:hypothetical protein